ncbi:6258_t:CDS:2 [Funneliformis geosporum]|uniref:6258_t:CDS:1 n=1 Tax=Funneliformis geosporum TaxID=1117311 RepID=A0A9W4WUC5_9GLOM|nr:6258_t:CDS:2 [Funneliformis geosporum]
MKTRIKNSKEITKTPLDDNEEEKVFHQAITRYQIKNNLEEREIANKLGLDKNTAARLLRGYIENFSLDSLIGYVEKLRLPLQDKV